METKPIQLMTKTQAKAIAGSCSQTSKMPCKSYELPTAACKTGSQMAKVKGSICSMCYAQKGFYKVYAKTIEPAQWQRLDSLSNPDWVAAMVAHIGKDRYFRWHSSGDLQSVQHLEQIIAVVKATPDCQHWLPTREYGMVKELVEKHGIDAIPSNMVIRLSAMFPDVAVKVPESLFNVAGVQVSNVHSSKGQPMGEVCAAPDQDGECRACRKCWQREVTAVSYLAH